MFLDSFTVYLKPQVKSLIAANGIEIIYIPKGLKGELQALDIGINKPFKHWLREETVEAPSFESFSASEKRIVTSRSVSNSWMKISGETVINSFNIILLVAYSGIEDAEEVE